MMTYHRDTFKFRRKDLTVPAPRREEVYDPRILAWYNAGVELSAVEVRDL